MQSKANLLAGTWQHSTVRHNSVRQAVRKKKPNH